MAEFTHIGKASRFIDGTCGVYYAVSKAAAIAGGYGSGSPLISEPDTAKPC